MYHRTMKLQEPRRFRLLLAACLALAVLVIAALATVRLHHDRRQAVFGDPCARASVGDPVRTLLDAYAAMGERASTSALAGSTSTVPAHYTWFRRTGLSRHQQCTVRVDVATQHITHVHLNTATDFTRCRNTPRTYPRRHWLCAVGDVLAL